MSSTQGMPTEEQCLRLLREEGCARNVIEHVCTVERIALEIAVRSGADLQMVKAGALLHDVGRCHRHDALHASEGAQIAMDRGLPDPLVRIIRRHIAAGLTHEEAEAIGLPPGDYMPETLEEKIVCHADNLVKGTKGVQTLEQAIEEMLRRGYPVTAERMKAMHAELSAACGIDVDRIVKQVQDRGSVKGPCAAYTGP